MNAWAVIAAAGSGSRMAHGAAAPLAESSRSKVLLGIGSGPSALELSLRAFAEAGCIGGCVLAVREQEREEVLALAEAILTPAEIRLVIGGSERQESVYKALQAIPADVEAVLIHDAARPFCSPELILKVLAEVKACGACIPTLAVKGTLKKIGYPSGTSQHGAVEATIPRKDIAEAQTPQGFRRMLILEAHEKARQEAYLGTDDSELVERLGHTVRAIPGSEQNFKITTAGDLGYAEYLIAKRY